MKKFIRTIVAVFLCQSVSHAGTATKGADVIPTGVGPTLRDLLETPCHWISGADFAKKLNYLPEVLNKIEYLNFYLEEQIAGQTDEVSVCPFEGELTQVNTKDAVNVTIVESQAQTKKIQLAVRWGSQIWVSMPYFNNLVDPKKRFSREQVQAYTFIHELVHPFIADNVAMRNRKVKDLVAAVANSLDPDDFLLQIQMNEVLPWRRNDPQYERALKNLKLGKETYFDFNVILDSADIYSCKGQDCLFRYIPIEINLPNQQYKELLQKKYCGHYASDCYNRISAEHLQSYTFRAEKNSFLSVTWSAWLYEKINNPNTADAELKEIFAQKTTKDIIEISEPPNVRMAEILNYSFTPLRWILNSPRNIRAIHNLFNLGINAKMLINFGIGRYNSGIQFAAEFGYDEVVKAYLREPDIEVPRSMLKSYKFFDSEFAKKFAKELKQTNVKIIED